MKFHSKNFTVLISQEQVGYDKQAWTQAQGTLSWHQDQVTAKAQQFDARGPVGPLRPD
jgi:hypothetical protein